MMISFTKCFFLDINSITKLKYLNKAKLSDKINN